MIESRHLFSAALAVASLSVGELHAQIYTGIEDAMPIAMSLDGTTKYDGWYNLSSSTKSNRPVHGVNHTIPGISGYPALGSPAAWANPIKSQFSSNSTTAAGLNKISGTPNPGSDGLYALSWTNTPNTKGGSLGVYEDNPVANLSNVVLQIETGLANGYDFLNHYAEGLSQGALDPSSFGSIQLHLTFGDESTTAIGVDFAELLLLGDTGPREVPNPDYNPDVDPEDDATMEVSTFAYLYGFQWDLSAYSDISSFHISFDIVEHSSIYSLQLDQSSVFNQIVQPIPEPSTWALIGAGAAAAAFLRRRKR